MAALACFPEPLNRAELIAARYDGPDAADFNFRRPILGKYPDRFAEVIAREYAAIRKVHGRRPANLFILNIQDELSSQNLSLAASDDDLNSYAKKKANEFSRLRRQFQNPAMAVQLFCDIVYHKYGISPPLKSKLGSSTVTVTALSTASTVTVTVPDTGCTVMVSAAGVISRLCDELWWRRALRGQHIRRVEGQAIRFGLVGGKTDKYVSNEIFQRIRKQKRRNRHTLEHCFATNELGQEFTLQELADLSISNPINQRNELMTRIAGFDAIAIKLGHVGKVFTITCPSRMHARSLKRNTKNPNYDETTPREAQQYLNSVWSRMRSKLDRMGIKLYGFRVAEPHQDGTPHWHALLYMHPEQEKAVEQVIRKYALEDSPNEKGAQDHRVDVITIDRSKGTGASYLAKYISKGIDGHGLDSDIDGGEPTSAAERVKGWAVTWGNRQFQQIGGPPVTLWRELRRLSGEGLVGTLKELWGAANEGDWAGFVMLMGGPQVKRKDLPISIAKLWSDKPNRYQEPTGEEIIGITYENVIIPTRIHQWTVQYRPEKQSTGFIGEVPNGHISNGELSIGARPMGEEIVGFEEFSSPINTTPMGRYLMAHSAMLH